ncbi:MAG: amidohydrolase [Chloroflexi bacterium]|nr:amidohydrolase [Chloroflexota bacterium]
MNDLSAAIAAVRDQLIADRRHFHAHPELAFQEHETAAYVAARLRHLGIAMRTGVGKTGVVGVIRGGKPGKAVLLRADMDALPIHETGEKPYISNRPGVMHACGHDGHTAILLAAAAILQERREALPGNVVLAFQPAEESPPGGAQGMIADGAMDDPKVDAAFGLHLTSAPVGTVGMRAGAAMAAADSFRAEIVGLGGHASRPHQAVDPVLIAATCVTTLHTIVSREVDPLQSAVITIGTIQAGTVPNVIPATATMAGSVRTFDQGIREALAQKIERTIVGVARAMGGDATVEYRWGYPVMRNVADMTEFVRSVALEVVGPEKTRDNPPIMASEDVGYFIERAGSGCYFTVGVLNEAKGITVTNHNPGFDIDEDALPVGVEMLVRVAERYLSR